MELNTEQLRVLRHMLGIDRPDLAKPVPYRDYACDSVEVDYVQEIDGSFLKRSHPSWRKYIPEGDEDFRTLEEIFAPSQPDDSTPSQSGE